MNLLRAIERHLAATGLSETRFGREAVGDPRLVADLRRGRQPRRETLARIEAALKDLEKGAK